MKVRHAFTTTIVGLTFAVASPYVAGEAVTLLVHYADGSQPRQLLEQFASEYEKLHPEVDIQFVSTGGMDLLEKFTIMTAAGQAPDVIHVAPVTIQDMSGFLPLPESTAAKIRKAYIPAAAALSQFQGRDYGFTTEFQTSAVVYNKDLLADAGIDSAPTPASWDQYLAMARKLTKRAADGTTQLYGAEASDWRVTNDIRSYLNGNGYEVISPDGTPLLNSPQAAQAVEKWAQLVRDGLIAFGQHPEMISRGRAVMTTWEPWIANTLKQQSPDLYNANRFGVSPTPYGTLGTPHVFTYGYTWLIPRQAKHVQEALAFLEWLNLEPTQNGTTRMGDVLVALGSLPPTYMDLQNQPANQNGFIRGYIDSLRDYVQNPVPPIPGAQHWEDAWRPHLQAIFKGQEDVLTGLEKAQTTYRNELQKAAQAK